MCKLIFTKRPAIESLVKVDNDGKQTVTNCNQLKLAAEDNKMPLTEIGDVEQTFCYLKRK